MKILSDLRKWIDNTASRIADDEEDPESWDTPVLYLLEALENEAERYEDNDFRYEKMLYKLGDTVSDRLEDRNWGY